MAISTWIDLIGRLRDNIQAASGPFAAPLDRYNICHICRAATAPIRMNGMIFDGLVEREAYAFAYVFAPLPIVGAAAAPASTAGGETR